VTPEGKVKALVKRELATLPYKYKFMPVQNGMGDPALDFYCCINGFFVVIETKKPGGKLTPRQQVTAAEIYAARGRVYVVDGPDTLAPVMAALRRLCQ